MADTPDTGLLAQIGIGATTVAGWLWAMINRSNKKLEEVRDELSEHRVEIAKHYPTIEVMNEALSRTVQPIREQLAEINRKVDEIQKREMERLARKD